MYSYHSCRNRSCPKCHKDQTERWLASQRSRLPACGYYLLTFTLPRELHSVARANPKKFYGLLMKAGAGPGIEERAAIRRLPRPFADVVERATAQRIEDRYPDARAMAADLEPFARGGTTLTSALVSELCGDEIRDEQHRLASFTPDPASAR